MKNKKLMKVLLVLLAVVAAGVIFTVSANKAPNDVTEAVLTEEETTKAQSEDETEAKETKSAGICVHVCGSVVSPGVYYLNEGSRVHEAVERAGGLKEDAAAEYINLAGIITDGEQIYIPSKEDAESGSYEGKTAASADDGLVNINTAAEEELMTLPGIGQTKAKAIIEYREAAGGFETKEDLMNVSGIAESSYEKIKDYIKV